MKYLIVAALLTVCGATGAALAQQNQVTADSNMPLDKQFAEEAARQVLASHQLGVLASGKGTNPAINRFGARLNEVNADLQDALNQIAQQQHLQLPTRMTEEAQRDIEGMKTWTGEQFAQRFVPEIITRQERLVALFRHQAESGQVAEIKSFADKMAPRLEENLALARDLPLN